MLFSAPCNQGGVLVPNPGNCESFLSCVHLCWFNLVNPDFILTAKSCNFPEAANCDGTSVFGSKGDFRLGHNYISPLNFSRNQGNFPKAANWEGSSVLAILFYLDIINGLLTKSLKRGKKRAWTLFYILMVIILECFHTQVQCFS